MNIINAYMFVYNTCITYLYITSYLPGNSSY